MGEGTGITESDFNEIKTFMRAREDIAPFDRQVKSCLEDLYRTFPEYIIVDTINAIAEHGGRAGYEFITNGNRVLQGQMTLGEQIQHSIDTFKEELVKDHKDKPGVHGAGRIVGQAGEKAEQVADKLDSYSKLLNNEAKDQGESHGQDQKEKEEEQEEEQEELRKEKEKAELEAAKLMKMMKE